jgi:peroxin-19
MDHQEVPSDQQEQLDAVLDAALDELDDDYDDDDADNQEAVVDTVQAAPQQKQDATTLKDEPKPAISRPVAGPEPPPFDMGSFDNVMKQMFQAGEAGGDPEVSLDSFMKQLQSQLASELGVQEPPEPSECESKPTSGKSAKLLEKRGTPPAKTSCQENEVDRTISKLLNDMATANTQDDAEEITGGEEEMFRDMMKEFEKMGGGFDQDAVVDGMMQQLLSKDIMYEPMKQVTARFPSWLEEKKEILSEEEYSK